VPPFDPTDPERAGWAPSVQALLRLRSAVRNAFAHHVTVLGSSGDTGATDFKLNLTDLYTHRVNS
jgi:hypothetical protein